MKKELIVTDFDGTLVDTFSANLKAYQKAFAEVGLTLTAEKYQECFGYRFDRFMEAVGISDKSVADNIRQLKAQYYPEFFSELKINKALLQLIRTFHASGCKTALASTARRKNLMNVINYFGIAEDFDLILAGEDVKLGKPAPFIYYDVLKHFNLTPMQALCFEDSEVGIIATERAGMDYVQVTKDWF